MTTPLYKEFESILLGLIIDIGCDEEGYRKKSFTIIRKRYPQISTLTLAQLTGEFAMYIRQTNNTLLMPEITVGKLKITFTVYTENN